MYNINVEKWIKCIPFKGHAEKSPEISMNILERLGYDADFKNSFKRWKWRKIGERGSFEKLEI